MLLARFGFVICWMAFLGASPAIARDNKTGKKDIYDSHSDAGKQLAEALKTAKAGNKHILLEFGANWCPDCHELHDAFETNPTIQSKLLSDFVIVMIDVNDGKNADLNLRFGSPTLRGIPALVVLDPEGRQIFTKDTSEFYSGKILDPAKISAFLNKW